MLYSPGGHRCRKPAELYAGRIEALVWGKVSESFSNPQSLLEILKTRSKAALEIARNIKKELDRAEEQLRKKNLELQQVLSWSRQNLLSPDELKPQLAQVREQKQHWEEEITKLNQKLRSLEASDQNLKDAERLCQSIGKRLHNLTLEQKREFLRLVVERIWIDEYNNLEIEVIIPQSQNQSDSVICETAYSFKGEGDDIFQRGFAPLTS